MSINQNTIIEEYLKQVEAEEEEKERYRKYANNPTTRQYIEKFIKIVDKDRKLKLMKFNEMQDIFYKRIADDERAGKPLRYIVLKARQMGCSTFTGALNTANVTRKKNFTCAIVTHEDRATQNLFKMYKSMYGNLPNFMKPESVANNGTELVLNNKEGTGLNSRVVVMTATGDNVGRSFSLDGLHLSEVAFWKCDIKSVVRALNQALTDNPKNLVVYESTANGYNEFYNLWVDANKKGEEWNGLTPLFFAWFTGNEYTKKAPRYEFQINPKTDYEKELQKRFPEVTDDHLYWRRYKIRFSFNNDEQGFRQEFPSTPEEAFISSGDCAFDIMKLDRRKLQITGLKPIKQGYYKFKIDEENFGRPYRWEWVENHTDNLGIIKIYEEVKTRNPYMIGGDTAGEGSDNFVACGINNITTNQAFVLCRKFDEDEYTRQLYCLGMDYNEAMISVESNLSPMVNHYLEMWQYPNLHVYQTYNSFTNQVSSTYGYKTTKGSKPILVDNIKDYVRDTPEFINDMDTLDELSRFTKINDLNKKTTKYGASSGFHDDRVIALGIALTSRDDMQYPTTLLPEEIVKKRIIVPFPFREDEQEIDTGGLIEIWN